MGMESDFDHYVTLNFDITHDLDLGYLEIAVSQ